MSVLYEWPLFNFQHLSPLHHFILNQKNTIAHNTDKSTSVN